MKAKELLADPRNWTRGIMHETVIDRHETVHRYCVLGAISECYKGNVDAQLDAFDKLQKAIDNQHTGYRRIATWNDAPERTHAEVLAILEEADV